ncbi:MAG: APC family permease [Methanomassiliicoccus sp.]|nr:APC family permease [Methanomassiliicoccus sp.]
MSAEQKADGRSPDHRATSGKLGTFDVTSLVVGSIIGADIYVATAISSRLVGPASLVIWIAAGMMALIIAISFAYCVMALPRVGGPYAFVTAVSSPFPGFMIGWALLLAEWLSLAVFPVAFAQYFIALVPGVGTLGQVMLKALFIVIIVVTNVVGIKTAGRSNDALTLIKLSPLVLIIFGGLAFMGADPATVANNLSPFLTGGLAQLGQALVLIFWAYAGFELSTLPTDEVDQPERTVPKAIVAGMLIVMSFYLLTNLVVVASLPQSVLKASSSPLLDATRSIFSIAGNGASGLVLFVGVGALLSIMGADESGTLGTSRLAYAMSLDGLLPHQLARKHRRFHTPYLAIIALSLTAFVASLVGGLSTLINAAVFLLALVYLATCISAIFLLRKDRKLASRLRGRRVIPLAGAGFSILLLVLVDPLLWLVGLALLAVGVPIYIYFSPRQELKEMREAFYSPESMRARMRHESRRFLALPVHLTRHLYDSLQTRRRIRKGR